MICPDCLGTGHGPGQFDPPCKTCTGYGVTYCCDGENVDRVPVIVKPYPFVVTYSEIERGLEELGL